MTLFRSFKTRSQSILVWMGQMLVLLSSSALFSGCYHYEPLALGSGAVDARLYGTSFDALSVEAGRIDHPLLGPIEMDASDGLSSEEAAVLAVLVNPSLRAARNQRDEAEAQLLEAGLLPNPQLGANVDFVTGGDTLGTQTAFGYGFTWDLRSLLTRKTNIEAAGAVVRSVELDIAWLEWQTALAAKISVNDLIALRSQISQAEEISGRLTSNSDLLKKAADEGEKTLLDSSAATSSANDAYAILLGLKQEQGQARIALNRAIGFPAETSVKLQSNGGLPSSVKAPALSTLLEGLEDRRLDLIALKYGFESQDARLRTAILSRFPSINIGFNRATDTGNVKTAGPGATIDIPIFNRNQAGIALEKATRQRLLDEYNSRVFEARSDIASALVDIESLNRQIAHSSQALPTLKQVVEVSRKAADEGSIDILAYYSAQNDLTQKSIDLFKLKQQLSRSKLALEAAAAWNLSP